MTADFYNKVCLPLFSLLLALLLVCPWLGWKGGLRRGRNLLLSLAALGAGLALAWSIGVRQPLAIMTTALCVGGAVSLFLQIVEPATRKSKRSLAAWGCHLGVLLIALGIAFSGPGKEERELTLARGESVELGPYEVRLNQLYEGRDARRTYDFLEAELVLLHKGKEIALVAPQRRVYVKFGNQAFAEADTHFTLASEFYASLLGLDSQNRAVLRLSVHPLVNWIWLGGIVLCLAPFLGMGYRRFAKFGQELAAEEDAEAPAA